MNNPDTGNNIMPTGGNNVDSVTEHTKAEKSKTRPLSRYPYRMKKAVAYMVANGGATSTALRKAGYSEAIARNPQKVTRSKTWAELMASIDDAPLLERVRNIALGGSDRDSLQAVQLIQRWKGRDATTLKINTLQDEIGAVTDNAVIDGNPLLETPDTPLIE